MPWQSPADLARLYARCRALLFSGDEDFGIAPLECMAAGRPVIALAAGGTLETVVNGTTGLLLPSHSPSLWAETLRSFRADAFDDAALQAHPRRFDRPLHRERMLHVLAAAWQAHGREREPRHAGSKG